VDARVPRAEGGLDLSDGGVEDVRGGGGRVGVGRRLRRLEQAEDGLALAIGRRSAA
jgi:hypothetical protein